MFHNHKWNLIDKTILPPAIKTDTKLTVWGWEANYLLEQWLDAKREHVVLTFKCDCGKIRVEKH